MNQEEKTPIVSYLIYKAINVINGKCYIGQTCKTLQHRINLHKNSTKAGNHYYFHNALRKYGMNAFKWEILKDNITTKQDANRLEIEYINKYQTIKGKGYNISPGGGGGNTFINNPKKEEIREHLRRINIGKKHSAETKAKMSQTRRESKMYVGNKNPMYGRKFTTEHKEKIAEASRGRLSRIKGKTLEEFYGKDKALIIKNKISRGGKGRVFSEEHKKKIGLAHKGKIVSQSTREKLSIAKRGQKPPNTKLTDNIVKILRSEIFLLKPNNKSWNIFEKELAIIYNVSASIIRKIRYNVIWKNI